MDQENSGILDTPRLNFIGYAVLIDGVTEAMAFGDGPEALQEALTYWSLYKADGHHAALVAIIDEQFNVEEE